MFRYTSLPTFYFILFYLRPPEVTPCQNITDMNICENLIIYLRSLHSHSDRIIPDLVFIFLKSYATWGKCTFRPLCIWKYDYAIIDS